MKKICSAFGLVLTLTLLSQLEASAKGPIASTTYGGDSFYLYSGDLSWSAAEAAAVADGGTLAVLTTSAQTAAVYNGLIGNGFFTQPGGEANQAWLGATPADGSSSTTDPENWAWVTGAPWTAFDAGNFDPGEPNGDSEGLAINRIGTDQWNDEGTLVGGYIVEVRGVPDSCSTQFLMVGACALMGAVGRKFRKQ
jgi:hypothetical protein